MQLTTLTRFFNNYKNKLKGNGDINETTEHKIKFIQNFYINLLKEPVLFNDFQLKVKSDVEEVYQQNLAKLNLLEKVCN